jgi:ElaA protein
VHIGRIVVALEFRDRGVAQVLFEQALQQARTAWPNRDVALSAQVQVTRFYERFGFAVNSEMYYEDGIAYTDRVLKHPH